MEQHWFEPETGSLLFERYVAERPSFRKVMEDRLVTEAEVREQAARVESVLRRLDTVLSGEVKALATEAFCELAVLYAIQLKYAEASR